MKLRRIELSAIAAAVTMIAASPASANLVYLGEQNFQGSGLGAANTILTLQSPGNSTNEAGSVGRSTSSPSSDVITGDALTGSSQTQTRSLGSLGVTSAADLRVVFNAQEPGNSSDNSITLNSLVLTIYSPTTGQALFSSTGLTGAPLFFPNTFTGAGNSGFVFGLDATQAAAAQAAAFSGSFSSNLVGLSASASNATGGPETFFLTAVPEPGTYALMLAGLAAVGFVARRRKDGQS